MKGTVQKTSKIRIVIQYYWATDKYFMTEIALM